MEGNSTGISMKLHDSALADEVQYLLSRLGFKIFEHCIFSQKYRTLYSLFVLGISNNVFYHCTWSVYKTAHIPTRKGSAWLSGLNLLPSPRRLVV